MKYFSKFNSRLSRKNEMSDFDKDIRMNPHHPELYNERGNKRLSVGDFKGALEDFSKAVELDPKYSIHFFNCGVAKFFLKDFKGAIDEFNRAISLKPLNDGYYFNRGVAKCASGDIAGGIEDFSSAIELRPKYVEAHILRGEAKGGFVKGCYNPLIDNELISIFQGDLQSIEQRITEIKKNRLLRLLYNNWVN
jgi:lipoprotein NlpI